MATPMSLRYNEVELGTSEDMADRIRRVVADLDDIDKYYDISVSPRRHARLDTYLDAQLQSLHSVDFSTLDQQDRVDFLLLRNLLRRRQRKLASHREAQQEYDELIPFASLLVRLCEERQDVDVLVSEMAAGELNEICAGVRLMNGKVEAGELEGRVSKASAFKAARVVAELRGHLDEFYRFYATYDPMFDWWCRRPWEEANDALEKYVQTLKYKLAGMHPDAEDEIVGEPIGRAALLSELKVEMIAYSPEELINIAHEQYRWCEAEMIKASDELGFGSQWKEALEHVKHAFVPPGQQTQLVLDLAREGASYVKKNNLVTVPPLAEETYRMFMMTPAEQKVAPFFLGGESILVSYPTANMSFNEKRMIMRGNNRHFSRAVAFHELIPGHRLQMFIAERSQTHRKAFSTPFYVEGWAMYWEMVFWERGDFFVSASDRIGSLFWRMHRCARIIFSLNFHLGKMSAQECVDLLVNWVGHERSTAEGEVRRSLNGEWSPLYQCGYMLGALQLFLLRKEVLSEGRVGEKEFHDLVLKANSMPIELLRALLLDKELSPDYEAQWRFKD